MRHLISLIFVLGQLIISNMVVASDQNKSSEYQALLRCFVSYADKTEIIETIAHERGYEVKPTDIGGRFTFKAVMIGTSTKINHISLYAYFQAPPKDLPIHEAIYRGPFAPSEIPVLITPYNHLYAGEVERELKYHCELSKVKK